MKNPLKSRVQRLLRRMGLYHRLQASALYDLYWSFADKSMIEERSQEIEFYRGLLPEFRQGDVIFDIGANLGQKSDVFLRMGAKVVAVEPDESNQSILKKKFLWARLVNKPIVVVGKAVSDKCAVETMWIDAPGSAKNTLSGKWVETLRTDKNRFGAALDFREKKTVETTTVDKLMDVFGVPAFIKIDVEGYEPNVLRGLQRAVPLLSFEVNLPEFRPEGVECIRLLDQLRPDGSFNYATDCVTGLVLSDWLSGADFLKKFESCQESSIEIFWKTGQRRSAKLTQEKPEFASSK
jgi:FkbM family methyltransferase